MLYSIFFPHKLKEIHNCNSIILYYIILLFLLYLPSKQSLVFLLLQRPNRSRRDKLNQNCTQNQILYFLFSIILFNLSSGFLSNPRTDSRDVKLFRATNTPMREYNTFSFLFILYENIRIDSAMLNNETPRGSPKMNRLRDIDKSIAFEKTAKLFDEGPVSIDPSTNFVVSEKLDYSKRLEKRGNT